jgi:hypothetical protein
MEANQSAARKQGRPASVSANPSFPSVGTADARRAAAAEALAAELRGEKEVLERRLASAEREIRELRSRAGVDPDSAPPGSRTSAVQVAAYRPTDQALLANVPSAAVRMPSVPLRFSSIPVALRTGRRRALLVWGSLFAILLVVGTFVASTFLSRLH